MHTCGEPTRIVVKGYPELQGTLLEQRAQAKQEHDHIRKQLMLEPRGHFDMYGAILRPETELVSSGEADIGVLFTTNEGYSTMCGHATIALGRFLVDTHDHSVFPNRSRIRFNAGTCINTIRLHAPCGVVVIEVPSTPDGRIALPDTRVSFGSVESFATGLDVSISLPVGSTALWKNGLNFKADFCYGGAFYCLIDISQSQDKQLQQTGLFGLNLSQVDQFVKDVKNHVNTHEEFGYLSKHPHLDDLSFLYSVILVDRNCPSNSDQVKGGEAGLCIFADGQIDRSPTGSAVSARLANAYAKGELAIGDSWTYHSAISWTAPSNSFTGTMVKEVPRSGKYPSIITKVEGKAYYTGTHTFILEEEDQLANFTLQAMFNQ